MSYTQEQFANFRDRLLSERRRVMLNVASLSSDLSSSITDETEENGIETHMGDVATVTYLRELDLSVEQQEAEMLDAIDAALKAIETGRYGVCTNCGKMIGTDRLEALPWATLCINCERGKNGAADAAGS